MIRGQVGFKLAEVAQFEHSNARLFARFRFVDAHLVQASLLLLKAGKVTHADCTNTEGELHGETSIRG